ncbi:MAG: pyridoxamine 5'-phosphate oxidase family protein [Pyrinomonadaceae bacterium]
MIQIEEMSDDEIEDFLLQIGYGHLGCSNNDQPYVLPIHYAYQKPYIYFYTTEGLKSEIIRSNALVCLQVEQVVDNADWRSVVVNGVAEQITNISEREEAVNLILRTNPTLTPAISIRWMDEWIRENKEIVYRIKPTSATGRTPVKVSISAAAATPHRSK